MTFHHRYLAGEGPATLLLLHGTGGDENDLLPLGRMLAPGWNYLSPRGKVLENGMPRFFRRLAEGIFDLEDLRLRTGELAAFLDEAAAQYGFDRSRVVAAGYSNGANIAASLLLTRPGSLRAAILFRAMQPFQPETPPDLSGTPVFLATGKLDRMIPAEASAALERTLRAAGAEVTTYRHPGGHELSQTDVEDATRWLAGLSV